MNGDIILYDVSLFLNVGFSTSIAESCLVYCQPWMLIRPWLLIVGKGSILVAHHHYFGKCTPEFYMICSSRFINPGSTLLIMMHGNIIVQIVYHISDSSNSSCYLLRKYILNQSVTEHLLIY